MALDRSKFKSTVVSTIVEKDKELAASLGRDGGAYAKYIKFEDGPNLLRIYPSHPEEDGGSGNFAEPKVTCFVPVVKVERDSNGQEIYERGRPKMIETVQSVFNSRIHGNTPKDLIEEYVTFAVNKLTEDLKICQDPIERAKIQDKLNHIKGNYKLNIKGLNYKQAWVMYVDRIVGNSHTFGPIEIGPAVKEALNTLAVSTDSADNPLVTEPYTDTERGKAVMVKYNKNATKPQDYYKVLIDNVEVPTKLSDGQIYKLPRTFPLSDSQLEAFMKVTPLAKRFKNCFTRRDFEIQVKGLQFFDEKHSIGLFEDVEFLAIYEEIDAYYPEIEEEPEGGNVEGGDVVEEAKEVLEQQETEQQDMFDLMTRKELSEWHKKNRTGFIVRPTVTDDEIREEARKIVVAAEAEEEVEETAEQEEPTFTTKDRIAALRDKKKRQ